jgi:hypothetical protein
MVILLWVQLESVTLTVGTGGRCGVVLAATVSLRHTADQSAGAARPGA